MCFLYKYSKCMVYGAAGIALCPGGHYKVAIVFGIGPAAEYHFIAVTVADYFSCISRRYAVDAGFLFCTAVIIGSEGKRRFINGVTPTISRCWNRERVTSMPMNALRLLSLASRIRFHRSLSTVHLGASGSLNIVCIDTSACPVMLFTGGRYRGL